jgi:hypothetical protein
MILLDILSSLPWPTIILCLGGVISIAYAIIEPSMASEPDQKGITADAMVILLEGAEPSVMNSSEITVRFLTKEKKWITGKPKTSLTDTLTRQYEEGQTLQIVYDPNDPSHFTIKTNRPAPLGRILMIAAGLILFFAGIVNIIRG